MPIKSLRERSAFARNCRFAVASPRNDACNRQVAMPLRSPRWPFTKAAIDNSPDDWGGVYALWREETLLYVGRAPDGERSIRAALLAHLAGERGSCTQGATHYGWELAQDPKQRAYELLQEHVAAHRAYPPCNERR